MWEFKQRYESDFKNYVQESREIVPDIQDFRGWLKENWEQ